MIRADKYLRALRAIQQILVAARWMAGDNQVKEVLQLMDATEILPALLADEVDRTDIFRDTLEDISKTFPSCRRVLDEFECGDPPPTT